MGEFIVAFINHNIRLIVAIGVVLLARGIFSLIKMPKKYCYLLWVLVFARMCLLVSVESSLSILPGGSFFLEAADNGKGVASGVIAGEDLIADPGAHGGGGASSPAVGAVGAPAEVGAPTGEVSSPAVGAVGAPVGGGLIADPGAHGGGSVSAPTGEVGTPAVGAVGAPAGEVSAPTVGAVSSPAQKDAFLKPKAIDVIGIIWLTVAAVLAVRIVISYVLLKRRLGCSVELSDGIRVTDQISSPMVFGFWSAKIYIPDTLGADSQRYVIAHESEHIRRKDAPVRMICYILSCVYWFNPFVWLVLYFMGKDMEQACDEAAVALFDGEERKEYARVLVNFGTAGVHGAAALNFGAGNLKKRVKNIMLTKKAGRFAAVLAILIVAVLAAVLLTNPKNGKGNMQAVENVTEEPTEDGAEESAENVTEKPTENGAEKPTENGAEKPTENASGTEVADSENLPPEYKLLFRGIYIEGSDKPGSVYIREGENYDADGRCELSLWWDGALLWKDESLATDALGARSYYSLDMPSMPQGKVMRTRLMCYSPYGRQDGGASYVIYSFTKNGEAKIVGEGSVSYVLQRNFNGKKIFDVEEMLTFASQVGKYFDMGNIIVSTVHGAYEYDDSYDADNESCPYMNFIFPWIADIRDGGYDGSDECGTLEQMLTAIRFEIMSTELSDEGIFLSPEEMIRSVLCGRHTFVYADTDFDGYCKMKKGTVTDIQSFLYSLYHKNLYMYDFLVCDLDKDSVNEVVVELSPGLTFVLHCENGTVYLTLCTYRGMSSIKTDGTFVGSSGASNTVVKRGYFENGIFKNKEIAKHDMEPSGGDWLCYIDGERVTDEKFSEWFEKYNSGTSECERFEFTEHNVMEYIK